MQDKGMFDGFLRVIKYKSLENAKGINNLIHFDDKAKAVSEIIDNIIKIGKNTFRTKKPKTNEQSSSSENNDCITELDQTDAKETQLPISTKVNISINELSKFADMGNVSKVLCKLQEMALPEKWDIGIEPKETYKKNAILRKYFYHTFSRAIDTNHIIVDEFRTVVIFNTGLVDCHYQAIYALLTKNKDGLRQEWRFNNFFVIGSGLGKRILSLFNVSDLPGAPHYFDNFCDLLYDFRKGMPIPDYEHCIIDNIHRWPNTIHEHECPSEWAKIEKKVSSDISDKEKSEYFNLMRIYIKDNINVYFKYKSRFDDGIELAFKKVSWNYKTAIPMYWPTNKRIQLLLPLCLNYEDKVDVALVVNNTDKGYIGDTILTLDMAYINARLVCKPESDWLDT